MAEKIKTEAPTATVDETEVKSSEQVVKIIEPSLADDILKLEQLNLLRSVTLRMQGGRHPDSEIEALLQRRLNIPRESFQGPYAIRLVCTLMMIFVVTVIFWGVLWAFASMLNLSYFLRLISTGIATLFAGATGVAVFFPSSIPEEKALINAIEEQMNELRSELGKKQPETDEKPPQNDKNETATEEPTISDSQDPDTQKPDAEPPVVADDTGENADNKAINDDTDNSETSTTTPPTGE